jgi:hypothetical protein
MGGSRRWRDGAQKKNLDSAARMHYLVGESGEVGANAEAGESGNRQAPPADEGG